MCVYIYIYMYLWIWWLACSGPPQTVPPLKLQQVQQVAAPSSFCTLPTLPPFPFPLTLTPLPFSFPFLFLFCSPCL